MRETVYIFKNCKFALRTWLEQPFPHKLTVKTQKQNILGLMFWGWSRTCVSPLNLNILNSLWSLWASPFLSRTINALNHPLQHLLISPTPSTSSYLFAPPTLLPTSVSSSLSSLNHLPTPNKKIKRLKLYRNGNNPFKHVKQLRTLQSQRHPFVNSIASVATTPGSSAISGCIDNAHLRTPPSAIQS